MNCINCKQNKKIVYRTSPLGETPANWMCEECMKVTEPDLYAALLEDKRDEPFLNDLETIF